MIAAYSAAVPAAGLEPFRLKNRAISAPEMLCHTLNTAPGTVAIAIAWKCVAARLQASPEFCIPTSMLTAFALSCPIFRSLAAAKPRA